MRIHSIIGKEVSFMKQTFRCLSFSEDHYKMEFTLQPGGSVPPHHHAYMNEHFEIKEGSAIFTLEGSEIIKSAGEQLLVPMKQTHAIRNSGKEPMHCIVTYSPCSDTHRMFTIYHDLYERGYREVKLMMKGEYLCQSAGLEPFAGSEGILKVIEQLIQSIIKPIGRLKGWDKEAEKYRN